MYRTGALGQEIRAVPCEPPHQTRIRHGDVLGLVVVRFNVESPFIGTRGRTFDQLLGVRSPVGVSGSQRHGTSARDQGSRRVERGGNGIRPSNQGHHSLPGCSRRRFVHWWIRGAADRRRADGRQARRERDTGRPLTGSRHLGIVRGDGIRGGRLRARMEPIEPIQHCAPDDEGDQEQPAAARRRWHGQHRREYVIARQGATKLATMPKCRRETGKS